jgi:transcriptional antiterminator RfaH
MTRWYLVHTKPSAEELARQNLERQGYGVYVPRLATVAWRAGVAYERVVPLFPRYVFLNVHEQQQSLAPVRSSVGVANVVRFGAEYTVVAEEVVTALRGREDPQTGLHRLMQPRLVAGDAVTISRGPFAGLDGVFERESGADRVIVLLTFLGQEARMRVPARFVVPGHAA